MDNLQDNKKSNVDPSEETNNNHKDSEKQTSNNTGRLHEMAQPAEIIPDIKKLIPAADTTLLPNQFMGTPVETQAIPSMGDIIKSTLRFKREILLVFLIISVPVVIAIWTLVVPKYRAQAELRVRPIIPYLVFQTEESGKIPLYDSFVNTQVSIIMSPVVLQRVLDQPDTQETQWYKNPPESIMSRLRGYPSPHIDRLRDALSVRPRRETEIIDLAFINSSAKEAKLIANNVLDQYIEFIGEMSDATGNKIFRQLTDEYRTLENDIQGREISIAELRRKLGTGTPEELISGKRIRLDETQARFSQVQQSIALLEWEIKRDITDDGNDVSDDASEETQRQLKYYQDDEWRKLDSNVRTIRHNIANGLLTPNHPESSRIQKELEFAEERLQQREQQLDQQRQDRLKNPAGASLTTGASGLSYEEGLIFLEHQLERSKHEQQLLAEELKKQQAEFTSLFESAQLLEKENNSLQHKRELFSAVRQRLDQKNMESNAPGSIEMLTRAISSDKPYYDRRIAFTFMVLVLAFGAGCSVAYLKGSTSNAIYTLRDMPHPMQVPLLGYIPVTPDTGSLDKTISSATLESIRVVRTALLSRINGPGCTTVLITSSAEGTGKSTFAMMLSESLARSGKKVLLIDADLRKMTLTKKFDLFNRYGFIQSLNKKPPSRYYIFKSDTIPGLSFMPAGKRNDNHVVFEETANGHFNTHIDKLRKRFNIILLDSPPILPVADTTILSSQVDGTIIVERELVSNRTDVINALSRLSSAGGHLMGTVFIGSESQINYG